MNRIPVIILTIILVSGKSQSQDTKPDMAAMMKRWEELSKPGEWHTKLNDFVGSWVTSSSMWMEGPDRPATVTKGTAEVKWTLDGRFLQQDATGEMMGKPMHGIGYTGFDNGSKRYEMFWIDNTSTAMYTGDGVFDQPGMRLTFYGKMDDPTTGEYGKNVRYVFQKVDKDKYIFEIHDPVLEPKSKVVEIVYTRKK